MSEHPKTEAPPETVFTKKSECWNQIDALKADHEARVKMVRAAVADHWGKASPRVTWSKQGTTWRATWRHEGSSYEAEGPGADGLREAILAKAEARKNKR